MADSEELFLSQKTWNRSMKAIEKDGFREGFESGRHKSFQNGFNVGYKTGYELHFKQALLDTKKQLFEKSAISSELPKTKCVICSEKNIDEIMKIPLEIIIEKQKHLLTDS